MNRMTGRAGGDLPPWKRFHGPEGVRQAGMPGGADQLSWLAGRQRQTGRPYVFCLSSGEVGDMGPVDWATDTVTGAEAQSLPPPDA